MRTFLLVLMLIGTIAGIGAGYFGITERAKFYQDKLNADKEAKEAIEAKKEAESAKTRAEEAETRAKREAKAADEDKVKAVKDAEEARSKATQAESDKQNALKARDDMKKDRDEMETKMNNALAQATEADRQRDEMKGAMEAALIAQKNAEEERDKKIAYFKEASEEINKLRTLTEKARKIAGVVGDFNIVLFSFNEAGDKNFKDSLDLFPVAETNADKYKAIKLLEDAGKKYAEAKKKLDDLQKDEEVLKIDDRVGQIVEKSYDATKTNIECVNLLIPLLQRLINPGDVPESERQTKYTDVYRRKKGSDDLMAEVCKITLEITQEYELAFPEAQRKAIKQLQNDIHQRWLKPPRTEETHTPPPE